MITKTYDLILWSCNHTSRFPRNHRFVLGERIERNLYNSRQVAAPDSQAIDARLDAQASTAFPLATPHRRTSAGCAESGPRHA